MVKSVLMAAVAAAGVGGLVWTASALPARAAHDSGQAKRATNMDQTSPNRPDKVVKTEEEWRKVLTEEQYRILRGHGTERPFCGVNLEDKGPGSYHCVGCDLPLFKAGRKFDSGTGWPSYTEPATEDAVWYVRDTSYGMVRTEVRCARCDGHLGHVFDDGPPPTRARYCINGTILKFVPDKEGG
jgi:peptide-methionine (R)-S-oxide reductase